MIQLIKTSGIQWNIILDGVVKIMKYKKSTIDHAIYIKVFDDKTVPYLKVFVDDFINTTINETDFKELS